MRKVEFLEGLPALNTEIFNRLVKYLTEDLKLRFNDIFEPGILQGYPNIGEEFLITEISFNTSNPNNKKISFKIGPGIAYVSNDSSIISNPNTDEFVGDGFFERIYISEIISKDYVFSNETNLYIYISWKKEYFSRNEDKFTSLLDGTTLKPFLNDSYEITISQNALTENQYIFLGKIIIYQENEQWKATVNYVGKKYFKLRIKEEDFKSYLASIFKNGVITTRDENEKTIYALVDVSNVLTLKINNGCFDTSTDLFLINGYLIQNFSGLYPNENKYTINIPSNIISDIANNNETYYLYIRQINNYGNVSFDLSKSTDISDGIKVLKIYYKDNSIKTDTYDIFNIIDPVKTIAKNSIPLKLIKHDILDSTDKEVIKDIFDKIKSTDDSIEFIKEHHIYNDAITTNKIKDGSITRDKIAANAITDEKINSLSKRSTISYSFPRYMTQNISGTITNNSTIKFFIGQIMRLSRITFMFENFQSNITFSFKVNDNNFNVFLNSQNQPINSISINGSQTAYSYVIISYAGYFINNNNLSTNIKSLNLNLYSNNNGPLGILLNNEILSIVVDYVGSQWNNAFLSIELELEECSGVKTDLSSIVIYKNWKDIS
jgi:hypothetical protein